MDIQADIEARLATDEPDVEVLLAELVGGDTVRLFVDHPDGVTLEVCERITRRLAPLREFYALEVSSPGQDRPLTRPAHFQRFIGRPVRVRTREAREAGPTESRRPVRSFTGELVGASDTEVTVAADSGVVSIPYDDILRSNLVPGE